MIGGVWGQRDPLDYKSIRKKAVSQEVTCYGATGGVFPSLDSEGVARMLHQ